MDSYFLPKYTIPKKSISAANSANLVLLPPSPSCIVVHPQGDCSQFTSATANYDKNPSETTSPLKRRHDSVVASPSAPVAEDTTCNKIVIFPGRDESYPDALNILIHPFQCELCKTYFNSISSAKDHYESKTHDRKITAWLKTNFTEKGLEPPPIKRLFVDSRSGEKNFHCDLCDLQLTSISHAKQHFAGRKHRLVAEKVSKPSGSGYYNEEGKWIRTGTKAKPADQTADGRFGIGEKFKSIPSSQTAGICTAADSSMNTDGPEDVDVKTPTEEPSDAVHCKICNICVSSSSQMEMHLRGSKHAKKLKALNLETQYTTPAQSDTILESVMDTTDGPGPGSVDLSMYRTPTGSYYCQPCNAAMTHVTSLSQHLMGKKHLKKLVAYKLDQNKNETNIESEN